MAARVADDRSLEAAGSAALDAGPFHRLIRRDSDTLLIVFSSWNTPAGRFRPFRAIETLPYARLHLNAPDNAWYLAGIPGLGATPEAVVDGVARLARASGCRRVATFGSSMGGFGALAIGLDLGADVIVAHGLESIIGLQGSRSARGVRDPVLLGRGRARVGGWRRQVRQHRGRIHCYYGETDIQDPLHAAYLAKLTGVASVAVRGAAHDLERVIAATYGLDRHLREIVDGHADRFVAKVAAPPPPVRDVAQVYRRRCLGAPLARCRLAADSAWPGVHILRVVEALAAGDTGAAVDAAATAVRLRPDVAWFAYALILVLLGTAAEGRLTVAAAEGRLLGTAAEGRLPVAVRRSYLPKPFSEGAERWLAPVDAVSDYDGLLLETLDRAGRLTDGVAAAEVACRRCPAVPALLALRDRLAARAGT